MTDESDDVRTWNFPGCWMFSKFHPAVHMGIFAMILADGWMDGTDDRHADIWMEFQGGITFCLTDRQVKQLTYGQTCCVNSMTDRHIWGFT